MNQMKRGLFLLATICCVLFAGCTKTDDGTDVKEDLSYLYKTYARYNVGNNIYKNIWTYDGYKEIGYQTFMNGQLSAENKNYSYDGLNASWDTYYYHDGNANDVYECHHVECEYLDNTFLRKKYQKTEYYYGDSQYDKIIEIYYEYDGKKIVSFKEYSNGILTGECDYNYDGLHGNYISTTYSSNVVIEKRTGNFVCLDDTYRRTKSSNCTIEYYNGTPSRTEYWVYDYDGKKKVGAHYYCNGKLTAIERDFRYDGLTCYYFVDDYQDGEVVSTRMYEVEYLE